MATDTLAGGKIVVDGTEFGPSASNPGPATVEYKGPLQKRRLSGAPFLQGPAAWVCRWEVEGPAAFEQLYRIWNLKLNTTIGPRVTFTLPDPRNAGTLQTYDVWMDEPQFQMSELYVRQVVATFTEALD